MVFQMRYRSPLGILSLSADENALQELRFTSSLEEENPNEILQRAGEWLNRYFAGESISPEILPLDPRGTAFQKKVWQILLTIPYGKVMTYGQIAKLITPTMSAQAVGNAVGKNPLPVIIPCHRVVGYDSIGGFSSGLAIKKKLLAIENIRLNCRKK